MLGFLSSFILVLIALPDLLPVGGARLYFLLVGSFVAIAFVEFLKDSFSVRNGILYAYPKTSMYELAFMAMLLLLIIFMFRQATDVLDFVTQVAWVSLFVAVALAFGMKNIMLTRHGLAKEYLCSVISALPILMMFNAIIALFLEVAPGGLGGFLPVAVGGPNVTLGMAGVSSARLVSLPTIDGPTTISYLAVMSTFCSIYLALAQRRKLLKLSFWLTCSAISMTFLLWADGRGAIIFFLITLLVLAIFSRGGLFTIAKGVILVSIASPFLTVFIFGMLDSAGIGQGLIRADASGQGLATGRVGVFLEAGRFIETMGFNLFYGYGYGSIATSGFLDVVAFAARNEGTVPTAHNYTLQTLFDQGLLGLVTSLWLNLALLNKLSAVRWAPVSMKATIVGLMLFSSLIGWTESAGTLYHFQLYVFQYMIYCSFLFLSPSVALQNKECVHDPIGLVYQAKPARFNSRLQPSQTIGDPL